MDQQADNSTIRHPSVSNPGQPAVRGNQRVVFRRLFALLNIAHMVILGVILNSLVFGEVEVWLSFRLFVLATLLFAIATERGWLLLIALLGMLLAREAPTRSMMPEIKHAAFAFTSLLLVGYSYLASQIKTRLSRPIANLLTNKLSHAGEFNAKVEAGTTRGFRGFRILLLPACLLIFLSFASMLILSLSPTTYRARLELFRMVSERDWLLAAASTLIVALLGTFIALREFGLPLGNRRGASLYLRSQLSLDYAKEIRILFNCWYKKQKRLRRDSASSSKP